MKYRFRHVYPDSVDWVDTGLQIDINLAYASVDRINTFRPALKPGEVPPTDYWIVEEAL